MSLARPLRCRWATPSLTRAPFFSRPFFYSSHRRHDEKRLNHDIKAKPTSVSQAAKDVVKPYTAEERKKLEEKYTPEQLATIDEGEEAVDADDLYDQAILRTDSMSPKYLDDFSKIRAYVDKPPKPASTKYMPLPEEKSDDELAADLGSWMENLPKDADGIAWRKYVDNVQVTKAPREVEDAPSYVRPPLPKFTDPLMRRTVRASQTDLGTDNERQLDELSKQTGMPMTDLRKLRIKMLVYRRVSNQTRMGKIHKNYYMYVAGNGRGLLGIGEGSSTEVSQATMKARRNAIRSMVPIPRYENRTIYGDVKGKIGATELELYTRPPGFGIRCQEKILEMCKCAGIADLSARVTRARNPMNTVKATMQALLKQRDPEQVARSRGRKIVDVRKVYYAGNLSP